MIRAQVDDWCGARRFRLDDVRRKNALDLPTVSALHRELGENPQRPFVLGSVSAAAFSAGADLKASDRERAQISDLLYETYERIVTRPGLVVAVIEGVAVGGGAQLAAAADLRIIGPGARMRWVGAGHGLVVGAWVLPTLIGRSRAADLAFSSRWLDAQGMVDYGFTAQVDQDPWASAETMLGHLTSLDAGAVRDFKIITNAPELATQLKRERTRNANWDGKAAFPE